MTESGEAHGPRLRFRVDGRVMADDSAIATINTIRTLRTALGLGLREAQALVDRAVYQAEEVEVPIASAALGSELAAALMSSMEQGRIVAWVLDSGSPDVERVCNQLVASTARLGARVDPVELDAAVKDVLFGYRQLWACARDGLVSSEEAVDILLGDIDVWLARRGDIRVGQLRARQAAELGPLVEEALFRPRFRTRRSRLGRN